MCPACDKERVPAQKDPRRAVRGRHVAVGRGAFQLDAVQAARIRALIDLCIGVGLGPDFRRITKRALPLHRLPARVRGGDQIARARQVALYLAHVGCGLTFTDAGRLYLRDRTTAAHACTRVEELRDDVRFDVLLGALEAAVRLGLRQVDPVLAQRALQR